MVVQEESIRNQRMGSQDVCSLESRPVQFCDWILGSEVGFPKWLLGFFLNYVPIDALSSATVVYTEFVIELS